MRRYTEEGATSASSILYKTKDEGGGAGALDIAPRVFPCRHVKLPTPLNLAALCYRMKLAEAT